MKKMYTLKKAVCQFVLSSLCVSSLYATRTWLGNMNSDWNNPSNWSGNALPNNNEDIVINLSGNMTPEIQNNSAFIPRNIFIQSGCILKIYAGITVNGDISLMGINSKVEISGGTLIIGGDLIMSDPSSALIQSGGILQFNNTSEWSNNGQYTATAGTAVFNGSTVLQQQLHGIYNFYHLVINQTKSMSTQSANAFFVSGNWTNNGSYINKPGASETFTGINDQLISGTSITTFSNLIISKSSPARSVSLGINVQVAENLRLLQGWIDLNRKSLTVLNPLASAVSRNAGFIKSENTDFPYGLLCRYANDTGSYLFPFGKSTLINEYIPLMFKITNKGSGNGLVAINTFATSNVNIPCPNSVMNTVEFTEGFADMVDRNWSVSLSGYSANPTADVTFTYTDSEIPENGEDLLRAWHWNGSAWDYPEYSAPGGQVSDMNANTVKASSVSVFSPWSLRRYPSPLPLKLIQFSARQMEDGIYLYWSTSSETNNEYFTVQKSQPVGSTETDASWESIAKVNGAGYSSTLTNYDFFDQNIRDNSRGTVYYRLKQTDKDGRFSYSHIIALILFENKRPVARIFPNPSSGKQICLMNYSCHNELKEVRIFDLQGRLRYSVMCPCERGVITVMNRDLHRGTWLLTVEDGGSTDYQRIVVQ